MKLKMKKNKILFLLTICILLISTGCNKNNLSENTEKDILSTIVNEDAIVNLDKDGNVLNYNDETQSSLDESTKEENKDSIESETTIEESISTEETNINESTFVEEETNIEESTSVENNIKVDSKKDLNCIIYLPDETMQNHITESFMADTMESVPDKIIEKLIEKNILNDKIKINNISFEKGDKCIIDFSNEYLEQIKNVGSTEEYFMVSCVVNSFIDTYDNVRYVMITVDGKGFETGHCEYYNYIPKY
jgi:hypothetical protein